MKENYFKTTLFIEHLSLYQTRKSSKKKLRKAWGISRTYRNKWSNHFWDSGSENQWI